MVDDEAFAVAVGRVGTDLVDGLLAVPFDSSLAAERLVGEFTRSWIAHLQDSVVGVDRSGPPRAGYRVAGPAGLASRSRSSSSSHQRFCPGAP